MLSATIVHGQIEVSENEEVPSVFGGGSRSIPFQIKSGAEDFRGSLRYQIFQVASSIAAPLGEVREWKSLTLPAGLRCLESVAVDVPAVRGTTLFQMVWTEQQRKAGTVRFRAFAPNLLTNALGRGETLAVFDPNDSLSAVSAAMDSITVIREFDGLASVTNLLVVGLTRDLGTARNNEISQVLKRRSAAGLASIWIQPEPAVPERPATAYTVRAEGSRGANIVVARERLLRDFAGSPVAHLNFIWLTELASGRKTLGLPFAAEPVSASL